MKKKVKDANELADLIKSLPVCSTKDDLRLRSAVVEFKFGPSGIIGDVDVEDRVPKFKLVPNGIIRVEDRTKRGDENE